MPPTHPSQADVAAAYRTLIAHETEPKEQDFYRTRLQRLEPRTEPESDDFVTQLAVKQIEGEAAWWRSIDFDRNASRTFESMTGDSQQAVRTGVERVLAHLTAAGRLIPAGGRALTAEQVEDVRTAVSADAAAWNRLSPALFAAYRLRRALFPATEPAEAPCTICNVNETNHAGVSYYHPFTTELGPFDDEGNDRPAPAEPAEEETKAEDIEVTPEMLEACANLVFDTDVDASVAHTLQGMAKELRGYNAQLAAEAAPSLVVEGVPDLRDVTEDETQRTYDEAVSLSYWLAQQLGEHVDDACDRGETLTDTVQRLIEHIRPNLGKTKIASSPVVPAPTETEGGVIEVPDGRGIEVGEALKQIAAAQMAEVARKAETGPWQTWQEVPEGVKYYGVGDTYLDEPVVYVNRPSVVRHRVDDGERSSTPDYEVESFAPFVAAEEG